MRTGLLPIVDNTKVVGLVALPGAMTGMLLAGASPAFAIRLQLVVMYMLLAGDGPGAPLAGVCGGGSPGNGAAAPLPDVVLDPNAVVPVRPVVGEPNVVDDESGVVV